MIKLSSFKEKAGTLLSGRVFNQTPTPRYIHIQRPLIQVYSYSNTELGVQKMHVKCIEPPSWNENHLSNPSNTGM